MEAKTISVKDAKATLSKKSPLPKKSLRKTLLSPYETIRPICSDSSEIEEIMRRLLVRAKRGSNWVPWSELKQMSEEERKLLKEKRKLKGADKSLRNQLVCGINEVFSAIEKHSLSSAVVSKDLEPAFLLNFVLDLATIHHVPILIVPKLRTLTRDTLGFTCSCFGIKCGAASENSIFSPLHRKIVELVREFEVPENGILCRCPLTGLLGDAASSDIREEVELGGVEVAGDVLVDSGWPCVNRSRQSYWKVKKEKLRKGERDKETVNESGMAASPPVGDESMDLGEDEEERSNLPATKSESKDSTEGHSWKKLDAHPYLRTFMSTVHHRKEKKQKHSPVAAESVIVSTGGKRVKKSKRNTNPEGVSEAGSVDAQCTTVHKSEGFQYRNHSKKAVFDRYKSLKLADG